MSFDNSTEETKHFEGEPEKYPEVQINSYTVGEKDKEIPHYH